jgi:hypothetical protein
MFDSFSAMKSEYMPGLEALTLTPDQQLMQATEYDQTTGSAIPMNSVGKLVYRNISATAWISDVFPTPFTYKLWGKVEHNAVAVAVTTAHTTFLDRAYNVVWEYCPQSVPNNGVPTEYLGVPLINFIDHNSDFKDPINLNIYSLSDDIMLFLILEYPNPDTKLSSISTAQNPLATDTPVSIFGYPDYKSYEQVYPLGLHVPFLEQTVIDAICGGFRLVRSDGVIKELGVLHAVSCTAASGMSGSPVVIEENGIPKVVGMLCGGPAAPLHRILIKILLASHNHDWSNAQAIVNDLETFPDLHLLISSYCFNHMKDLILRRSQSSSTNILNLYSKLLLNYSAFQADEICLNHNLILPSTSPGFRMAIHCSNQLSKDEELYKEVVTYEFLTERLNFYKTFGPSYGQI